MPATITRSRADIADDVEARIRAIACTVDATTGTSGFEPAPARAQLRHATQAPRDRTFQVEIGPAKRRLPENFAEKWLHTVFRVLVIYQIGDDVRALRRRVEEDRRLIDNALRAVVVGEVSLYPASDVEAEVGRGESAWVLALEYVAEHRESCTS